MVRDLKKQSKGLEGLEELEKTTEQEVEMIEEQKKKDFQEAEMDAGFFFSVVFNTKKERDEWLVAHKIKLEEDFFVKAKNFIK